MRPTLNNVRPSWKRRVKRPSTMVFVLFALFASVLSVNAATANAATPTCQSSNSDSDGDGWGFENGRSCRVGTNTPAQTQTQTSSSSRTCVDSDGDGWGWDGVATCRTTNPIADAPGQSQAPAPAPAPTSSRTCDDSDGDGWGWNGVATCRINNSVTVQRTPTSGVCDYFIITKRKGWGYDVQNQLYCPPPSEKVLGENPLLADAWDAFADPNGPSAGTLQWQLEDSNRRIQAEVDFHNEQIEFMSEALVRWALNVDSDADGVINGEDPFPFDSDNDGVPDKEDDYPLDNSRHDFDDRDGDGIPNDDDPFPDIPVADHPNDDGGNNDGSDGGNSTDDDDDDDGCPNCIPDNPPDVITTPVEPVQPVVAMPIQRGNNDDGSDGGNSTDDDDDARNTNDPLGTDTACGSCAKETAAPTHDNRGRPYCRSASSDSSGDGWGWENNASCVVR